MADREYLRTDKNGTKYYRVKAFCPKCAGTGYTPYVWVDNGICFECGGNGGFHYEVEKEYTPEYEEKLISRRAAKAEKRRLELVAQAEEHNKKFLEQQGFNENGKTYVVLGNTYHIKEELKSMGAKWCNHIGWHLPQDTNEYPTVEIDVEDVYYKDCTEKYHWTNWKSASEETYSAKIKEASKASAKEESPSSHVGVIGEKITSTVTFIGKYSYEVSFGYRSEVKHIYTFKDKDGNILVWKTTSWLGLVEGSKVVLTGTVKEHSEYKGVNQTVLLRCKIA